MKKIKNMAKHSLLAFSMICSFLLITTPSSAGRYAPAHAAPQHHRSVHHKAAPYTGPVNINTANAQQLSSIKGLGEKKAAAIIAYREDTGHFVHVNDLSKVKGLSAKTVARLEKNNPGRLTV